MRPVRIGRFPFVCVPSSATLAAALCAALLACSPEYGVSDLDDPQELPVVPATPDPEVPTPPVTDPDPTDPDPVDPDPTTPADPTAVIVLPSGPSTVLTGEIVTFVAEITDADTANSALAVSWSSNVDGALGGAWLATDEHGLMAGDLSAGAHVITLTVVDATGGSATDTVALTVDVPAPPAPAEPGDLVFSELMINPEVVDDVDGEWVELYNTAGYPIDVAGYTFHDLGYDSWVLTGAFVVPAHGYFVMCAETDMSLNGGIPCDGWFSRVSLGGGLALANGPDEVVLTRPDGVEIDRLEYDGTWFTNATAVGVDPGSLSQLGNDDLAVWCDQFSVHTSGGEPSTPGLPNDACF